MSKISQRSNSHRHWPWVLLGAALGLVAAVGLWQYSHQVTFADSLVATPEPEVCALCGEGGDSMWYHAPCVLDLSTGLVTELTVYDPHRSLVGEIAEEQQTGTLGLLQHGGLTVMQDTYSRTSSVTLPREQVQMAPSFFCRNCRGLLSEAAREGYVLLDLHDLQHITAYPIAVGAEYEIRDYTVSIWRAEGRHGFDITVQGHLFLDEPPY